MAHLPGPLGQKPFLADGSVDSDVYIPRDGSMRVSIQVTADQPGDAQVFLVNTYDQSLLSDPDLVSVSALAGNPNIHILETPLRSMFDGVVIRFTNTNTTAGTAEFSATDGGL